MSTVIKRIEEILQEEFVLDNYITLVKEIYSTVSIKETISLKREYSNFSSHVEGSYHIGNYITPDNKKIAVFAVPLKQQTYVENARSTQRSYAKKLIENGGCDAALIAFYTPGDIDKKWRLSFVCLDYEMKIEHGKMKTEENLTPAKRYSYLVGKGEPCHTAISRFRQFIIDNNSQPSMEDMEVAFSVEAVTEEFFDLYRKKYYQLYDYLETNSEFVEESNRCGFSTEQFTKKLLGQIVFLYFLQKKGWLGVGAWKQSLTSKEYKDIYYTNNVSSNQRKLIQEYLPKIYLADGNYYRFVGLKALENLPKNKDSDVEKMIAEQMPASGEFSRSITDKQYNDLFNNKGVYQNIIKKCLPILYSKDGNFYLYNGDKALDNLTDDEIQYMKSVVPGLKGWGSGSKSFLRTWFDFSQKHGGHFYEKYLEPLFYGTLNENRGELGYSSILHCRIPFLSGGLFEPIDGYDWENTCFDIPDALFSNRDNSISEFDADGILDVFDRYNFTISEDEPMEREVAIDPEMLGKVFENLLDVNDRKSKGAFYTPREIVHYMCKEVLIKYIHDYLDIPEEDIREFSLYGDYYKDEDTKKTLAVDNETGKVLSGNDIYTRKHHMEFDKARELRIPESLFSVKKNVNRLIEVDELLKNIRVVDLAVGSGAFPLGMLNEIVRMRQNISAYYAIPKSADETRWMYINERSPYILKKETIHNCIYAADIEPSAVDIARLRLWLSLVIDDEITLDAKSLFDGHRNPLPLPNLECNIVCGNSLIDEYKGFSLIPKNKTLATENEGAEYAWSQDRIDAILPKFAEVQDKLFMCNDALEKKKLRDELKALKDLIMQGCLSLMPDTVQEEYKHDRDLPSPPFVLWQIDFARVFNEKGGFDVAIGNPPYVGESGHKEMFRNVSATSFGQRCYKGKMDFFYFFFHKGLDLLHDAGICSLITTNYYLTNAGAQKLREDFKNRANITRMVNFNELKIFKSALGQHNIITFLAKEKQGNVECCITNRKGYATPDILNSIVQWNDAETQYFTLTADTLYDNAGNISFHDSDEILTKMVEKKNYCIDKKDVGGGIDILQESVTEKHLEEDPSLTVGSGIFAVENDEIEGLGLDDNEREILKPYYTSEQIQKYCIKGTNHKWILYTDKNICANIDSYPNIKKHLDKYQKVITSDNKPYGLHRPRVEGQFKGKKLLSLRMTKEPCFTYTEIDTYVTRAYLTIKLPDMDYKYAVALLNSKLFYYWLFNMGKRKGKQLQIDQAQISDLPLVIASPEVQENIIGKIDVLLSNEERNLETDSICREIDEIVYSIYGLNHEEISRVEAFVNKQREL